MKKQFIVHRPIDDTPEIPNPYRQRTTDKFSFTSDPQKIVKRIQNLREESEETPIPENFDHSPVISVPHRDEHIGTLQSEWSQQRREIILKLLIRMYKDDGKTSTDAFLLEAIRSF